MKQASLETIFKRKYKTTTNSSHCYPVAENKLEREFTVNEKNEVWVSDITYRPIINNAPLLFHSDRGIQYACGEFVRELENHRSVARSMSGKGNCRDNAVAESFFKTLKVELIYQNHFHNKHEAESSISEYIENFYNTNRRHKHLDNMNIFEYQKLQNRN